MSTLIKVLIDEHDCDPNEVAAGIGATREEIDLLYQDHAYEETMKAGYRYSRAWVPEERTKP